MLAWADENEDAGTWKSTPGHEVSLTHIGIPAISFQGRSAKGESQNLGLTFRNIELGIWHLVLSWCWLGTLSPCVSSTKAWMQDHRIIPVSGEKKPMVIVSQSPKPGVVTLPFMAKFLWLLKNGGQLLTTKPGDEDLHVSRMFAHQLLWGSPWRAWLPCSAWQLQASLVAWQILPRLKDGVGSVWCVTRA